MLLGSVPALQVGCQEIVYVFHEEPAVAAAAYAVNAQDAVIAPPSHGIDVNVKQVRQFAGSEHIGLIFRNILHHHNIVYLSIISISYLYLTIPHNSSFANPSNVLIFLSTFVMVVSG
jgi:hypothetical protein